MDPFWSLTHVNKRRHLTITQTWRTALDASLQQQVGGDSDDPLQNNSSNYGRHFCSTHFQRASSTFKFIRLFDLIKVPQMGGDDYDYHFKDLKIKA